jgi:hypothetical protein
MKDVSEIRERKFSIQNLRMGDFVIKLNRSVTLVFLELTDSLMVLPLFSWEQPCFSCWHARFRLYVFLYFFQCILCLPNCTIHRLMRQYCTNLMHRWLVPSNFFCVLSPWSSNRSVIGSYIGSTCSTCSFVFTKTSSLSIIGAVSAAFRSQ